MSNSEQQFQNNSVPSNIGEMCEDRKLFIGGFPLAATENDLRDHFSKFGEIDSIQIKTDAITGRSRGFAFLIYTSFESCNAALNNSEHVINGKTLDVKKAKVRQGKIFVGGIKSETPEEEIRAYFGKFGNIVTIEWPFDKTRNQRKGYCFIVFDSDRVANDLVKQAKHTIGGKEVDVKKAIPSGEKKPGEVGRGSNGNSATMGYGSPGANFQSGVQFGQPYYIATPNYNFYGSYGGGFTSSSPANGYFPGVADAARFRGKGGVRQQNRQQPY